MLDRLRLDVDGKDALVYTVVHTLQHRVVVGIFAGHSPVFLNTLDALESHVLGNLDGVGRPRGHHLAARSYEIAVQPLCVLQRGIAVEPA